MVGRSPGVIMCVHDMSGELITEMKRLGFCIKVD